MSDADIIEAFKRFDPATTRTEFYANCQAAHRIFSRRYGLDRLAAYGFDPFSLAHDYYIRLATENFAPLEQRPQGVTLRDWMIGGYRFVILRALKAYNRHFDNLAATDIDRLAGQLAASPDATLLQDVAAWVEQAYRDPLMGEIARGLFVLGYKQTEVAEACGITPSAVNQRYKRMMNEVVIPQVCRCYPDGLERSCVQDAESSCCMYNLNAYPGAEDAGARPATQIPRDRITAPFVDRLEEHQVFVFGTDPQGLHFGSCAQMALRFGAVRGVGSGLQGRSYAIPVMGCRLSDTGAAVEALARFAAERPEWQFLIPEVGCGTAGYNPETIAPLFKPVRALSNVTLPQSFWISGS